MKKVLSLLTLLMVALSAFGISHSASAEEFLYRCKKRAKYAWGSYYWTTIEKTETGSLLFTYAVGDDQTISMIYLQSPVTQVSPGVFAWDDSSLKLDIAVKKEKMSFVVESGGKQAKSKNLVCE